MTMCMIPSPWRTYSTHSRSSNNVPCNCNCNCNWASCSCITLFIINNQTDDYSCVISNILFLSLLRSTTNHFSRETPGVPLLFSLMVHITHGISLIVRHNRQARVVLKTCPHVEVCCLEVTKAVWSKLVIFPAENMRQFLPRARLHTLWRWEPPGYMARQPRCGLQGIVRVNCQRERDMHLKALGLIQHLFFVN